MKWFFRSIVCYLLSIGFVFADEAIVRQSPEKLAEALFWPYLNNGEAKLPDLLSEEALPTQAKGYLSGDLAADVGRLVAAQKKNPDIYMDFDPLIDGQDFIVTDLKVHPALLKDDAEGGQVGRVVVSFKNFGEERELWLSVARGRDEKLWSLTAVRAEKAYEGRSYELREVIDGLLSDEHEGMNDFSGEQTSRAESLLTMLKELDPALAEDLEKNYEALGHRGHEGRETRRVGEFGYSTLGQSTRPPFVSLWRKRNQTGQEGVLFQLTLLGEVELLDEKGKPLVLGDPLPTQFQKKIRIQSYDFSPVEGAAHVAEGESRAESLGNYLLARSLEKVTMQEAHEIEFDDERKASLLISCEGGLVSGIRLVYSEGGEGSWRFDARSWTTDHPNVLLVEILDAERKVVDAEDSTAWILYRENAQVILAIENEGKVKQDRQDWPESEMDLEAVNRLFSALSKLVSAEVDHKVAAESVVNAWIQVIE